ncbi:hypothetical protein CPB97_007219 [Podila verticillata]|nr:hypothetical protein CPB97_007219 [Podila verticillata]
MSFEPENSTDKSHNQIQEASISGMILGSVASVNAVPVADIEIENKDPSIMMYHNEIQASVALYPDTNMNAGGEPSVALVKPGPLNNVPLEVLLVIFENLKPSDLYKAMSVRKNWKEVVVRCSIWRTMYSTFPDYDEVKESLEIFSVVHRSRSEFCEACLKRFHNPRMWRKNSKEPAGPILQPQPVSQNHGYRLCLACRILYYTMHPEPYPEEFRDIFDTKRNLMAYFAIHFSIFKNITFRTTASGGKIYNKAETILFARKLFGGEIGVTVARAQLAIKIG